MLRKKEEMKEWQRELLPEEHAPKKVIVVTSGENEAEVKLPNEVHVYGAKEEPKEAPKKTPAKKTTAKKTTRKPIEKMEVKE